MNTSIPPPHVSRLAYYWTQLAAWTCLSTFAFPLITGLEVLSMSKDADTQKIEAIISVVAGVSQLSIGIATMFCLYLRHLRLIISGCLCVCALLTSLFTWSSATASGIHFVWLLILLWGKSKGLKSIILESGVNRNSVRSLRTLTRFASSASLESTGALRKEGSAIIALTKQKEHIAELMSRIPLIVIVFGNCFMFAMAWNRYKETSVALALARACAATINFNMALIGLPTLHRVWKKIVNAVPPSWRPAHYKSIQLHRVLALLIVAMGFLHVQAHNAFLSVRQGQIYIVRAWVTGIFLAALVPFICIWSSVKPPRRQFVQVHVIGILFGLVLVIIHSPRSGWWCLPAIILTSIERVLAARPRAKRFQIKDAQRFGQNILHITFKGTISMHGGEYVYINIPTISLTEWRPFTMIPQCDNSGFSLFIRIQPSPLSWTNRLCLKASEFKDDNRAVAFVDGPFISPACSYVKYTRLILTGTGVGVTPIISILRSLQIRTDVSHIKCVTVAWVLPYRETNEFKWVLDDFIEVIKWSARPESRTRVRIHVYVTGCVPSNQPADLGEKQLPRPIWNNATELFAAIANPVNPAVLQGASYLNPSRPIEVWRGRPFFSNFLSCERATALSETFLGTIGVFSCGSAAFAKDLESAIRSVNRSSLSNDAAIHTSIVDPALVVDRCQTSSSDGNNSEIIEQKGSIRFRLHPEIF